MFTVGIFASQNLFHNVCLFFSLFCAHGFFFPPNNTFVRIKVYKYNFFLLPCYYHHFISVLTDTILSQTFLSFPGQNTLVSPPPVSQILTSGIGSAAPSAVCLFDESSQAAIFS